MSFFLTLPLYHIFSQIWCKTFALLKKFQLFRPQIRYLQHVLDPVKICTALDPDYPANTFLMVSVKIPHSHELVLLRPTKTVERILEYFAPLPKSFRFVYRFHYAVFYGILVSTFHALFGVIYADSRKRTR